MKNNKQKKSFILFISVFTAAMLLFSFSSCEFFSFNNEIEKIEELKASGLITSETPGTIKLTFTPDYTGENKSGRSAYPDFSDISALGLSFTIKSDYLAETEGSFDSTSGKINFEIPSRSFTDEDFSVFANKSGKKLLFAKVTLSYTEGGASTSITDSIYFKPYTAADGNTDESPNGFINLKISVSKNYTIECDLENNNDGKILINSSPNISTTTCTLSTDSAGVSPGNYKARISVKSGSNIVDFRIQTIYVWPGMTTDCWYLSNGEKSSNYNIEVNSCQLYVMGDNPTGLYSDAGIRVIAEVADPSDVNNDGTILKPLQTINAAIEKCANDNKTDYIIICDGDLPGFTIGANNSNSKRNLTIKGGGNSNNYSNITSGVTFYTTNNIIFENLKFSNLNSNYSIYGTFITNGGKKLTLNNCCIENDTYDKIGIGCGGSVTSYSLELNDTKISCTKREALLLGNTNTNSTVTLRIKGSTFIEPYFDDTTNQNRNSIEGPTKIIIDGPLTDSHTILGAISLGSGYEPGYQLMTAVNGANLAKESQRFEVIDFPKILNTDGKVELSKDFYVAASTATPAGSPSGTGSATRPLDTVTAAVAKINEAANSTDGAGDYTIHISGTIKENDTINLVGSSSGSLSSFYNFNSTSPSTLTLCGTNKDNDKLDGNGSHQVLKIQGNSSYRIPVTIENLTIQNGKSSVSGGGIYASYTNLKLGNGCVITKNETSKNGGAVYLTSGNLFMYGDALIGYNNASTLTTSSAAKAAGGNIAAQDGGAIYAYGENLQNTCDCYIWIGYTSENVPDASGKTPKISGNCIDTTYCGGGISYNAYVSLNICKGEISYNYAQNGGGIYSSFRGYSHNERNISGVTIKGNQARLGGGIYVSSAGNGSAGYLHLSGTTVIEENEALGDSGMGGAIYGGGEMEIEGAVYIPFEAVKKNDVYMPSGYQLKLLDTLEPPPAANGITATITPQSYSVTDPLLRDDDSGAKVAANNTKLAVTPEGTKRWKLDLEGKLYLPFKVTIDDGTGSEPVQYLTKSAFASAIQDSALSGKNITVTVFESDVNDFGPSDPTNGSLVNVMNTIRQTSAKTVDLIVDENANIKLPENSSAFFANCSKLYKVDLAGIDTSDVTNMNGMFFGCFSNNDVPLDAVLDIRNFNTNNVTNMGRMFCWCSKLKTIIVGTDFSVNNVTIDENMFSASGNLEGGSGTRCTSDSVYTTNPPVTVLSGYARIDGGPHSSTPGYFTAANYIGSKRPLEPKEVGDIVFNDGSSMPYTEFAALDTSVQDEKKTAAIALIFYKGTELNKGDDTTTIRTLGVGLKHDTRNWCTDGDIAGDQRADAYNINITTIKCTANGSGISTTFTGDKYGSDNLEQIEAFDGINDTSTEEKYPAFYFAKKYSEQTIGSEAASRITAGSEFENGWYLPSIAELFQIYVCREDTSNGFDIDTASQALGGDVFGSTNNSVYWSSSQHYSDDAKYAYQCNFKYGGCGNAEKTTYGGGWKVCAIREF